MATTHLLITSPQNVELEYQLAPLGARMGAFALDLLFVAAYYVVVFYLLFQLLEIEDPVLFFLANLPSLFYRPVCEIVLKGQTIGKRQQGLRVMRQDGQACLPYHYVIRWLMEPIDTLFGGGPGLISVLFSERKQRLGDLMAGTVVVKDWTKEDVFVGGALDAADQAPHYPGAAKLTPEHIQLIEALIRYNKNQYDPALVEEYAKTFGQIVQEKPGDIPLRFLYRLLKDYYILSREELLFLTKAS